MAYVIFIASCENLYKKNSQRIKAQWGLTMLLTVLNTKYTQDYFPWSLLLPPPPKVLIKLYGLFIFECT